MSGVPYLFASASGTLPLSQLDTNFSTPVTIGTTSVALGNTVTTLAGLTLSNPTISTPNFTTNVGIGTSTPTSLLQIVGATDPVLTVTAASSGSAWLSLNGISSAVVHNPNNVATVLTTNGTERMRISAAGNVGIGTSAPSYLLDVNGTGRFTGAVTTAALTASSLSLSTALSAANGGTGVSNASLTPITATGSTTARTLGTRFANPLNLRDFGATGNGVTNDSIAFAAWLAAVLASGTPGYIPQGTYVLTTQVVFSMNALSTVGVTIFGDGVQQSILDVQGVSSYPQVLLTCTATPADFDYIVMRDFGIRGNCAGPVFQIGAENYSDPCNEPEFDLWVTNFSTSTSAIAVELNYVLNGQLRFVADVAGAGVAVRVRQTEFSTFQGSYSALGGTSLQITAGVSFGNLFENLDLENVATCVKIDSSNAVNNIFLGGQWSYTAGAINATAGKDNVFIAPNPAPVSPGTLAGFLTSATGVLLMGPGYFGISTPAVPSSGVPVTNNSGQMVVVSVGSVPLSSVAINGVTYPDIVINVSGTNYQTAAGSYVLSPGDTITLNYSGSTPSWVWKPLP